MSKWLEMNRNIIDYNIAQLRKLYYMNIESGDLDLNAVAFLINSMVQEITRLDEERKSEAEEKEKIKQENSKLKEKNERVKNENS